MGMDMLWKQRLNVRRGGGGGGHSDNTRGPGFGRSSVHPETRWRDILTKLAEVCLRACIKVSIALVLDGSC